MNFFGFNLGNLGAVPMHRHSSQLPPPVTLIKLLAYSALYKFRDDLDEGNKILLPPAILQQLSNYKMPYPMIFSIQNDLIGSSTNVGVLEFTSDHGTCILPSWMFEVLNLEEGAPVNLQLLTNVPKGKYVRLQPHKTEFIDLPDPRAILERQLANFTCLTEGDTISIKVIDKFYQFNLLSVEPKTSHNCICVIEADIEVDFAQPLDYEETSKLPQMKKEASIKLSEEEARKTAKIKTPFQGKAVKINGQAYDPSKAPAAKEQKIHEEWDPRKHRIHYGLRGGSQKLFGLEFKGAGTSIGQSQAMQIETPALSSLTRGISQTSGDSYKIGSPQKSVSKLPTNKIEEEKSIKTKPINDSSKGNIFSPPTQPGTIIGASQRTSNPTPSSITSQSTNSGSRVSSGISSGSSQGTGTTNKPGTTYGTNTSYGSNPTYSTNSNMGLPNKPATNPNTSGTGFNATGVGSTRTNESTLTRKPSGSTPSQPSTNTQPRPPSSGSGTGTGTTVNKTVPPKSTKK
jgi:ubiquitin fusion degradation protein 1